METPTDGPEILVVEDDPPIARLLRLQLMADGYRVVTAGSQREAVALLSQEQPDLVILDLVLPDSSGLDLLRRMKASSKSPPVVVISARSAEGERLAAIEIGADDFIPKPFSLERVTATVEFLIARSRGETGRSVIVNARDVSIDLLRADVTRNGERVALSRSEWRLLEELASRPGEPRLAQELLSRVWGADYQSDLEYLAIWIRRLRSKLGDDDSQPALILPYFGVGYLLNAETSG